MNSIISVQQFSFAYEEKLILDGINLSVAEGEYTAMIGPNGAGKSTLLKCLNRILKKGKGRIQLFGRNIEEYTQKELARLIGYVPQTREQVFPYTVYDFVLMGRYPYMHPLARVKNKDKRVVEEALEMCGISQFAGRSITHLSGGERQKVYLAAALAQQPKILLLDEPTAHLDPKYHMEIQKTICEVSRKMNITVLHVTHDLTYLLHWSQKVIALKEGKICFCDVPQKILENNHLYTAFQTHFLTVEHPGSRTPLIIPEVSG